MFYMIANHDLSAKSLQVVLFCKFANRQKQDKQCKPLKYNRILQI